MHPEVPVLALPWAARPPCPAGMPQDGPLLARGHPLGCYSDLFFPPTVVQGFPMSWCSSAVPTPGSHGGSLAQAVPLTSSALSWRERLLQEALSLV